LLDWLRKKKPAAPSGIRETLFGDLPLEDWGRAGEGVPWSHFALALRHRDDGDRSEAVAALGAVVDVPGLESRHYLQAWHALRGLGVAPDPEQAKVVYGVVTEMGMPGGLDLLATYADHRSRYYNFSGTGVVCDEPLPEVVAASAALMKLSTLLISLGVSTPWTEPRRPPPGRGVCRISFLTPAGPHFCEGPADRLASDPNAGVILRAATALMQVLVKLPVQFRRRPNG
jgi:hypothetical protein